MKNIIILSITLLGIMLVSTILVLIFNSSLDLNTDVNNHDVATSIAGVAFLIALIWKYIFDKSEKD